MKLKLAGGAPKPGKSEASGSSGPPPASQEELAPPGPPSRLPAPSRHPQPSAPSTSGRAPEPEPTQGFPPLSEEEMVKAYAGAPECGQVPGRIRGARFGLLAWLSRRTSTSMIAHALSNSGARLITLVYVWWNIWLGPGRFPY